MEYTDEEMIIFYKLAEDPVYFRYPILWQTLVEAFKHLPDTNTVDRILKRVYFSLPLPRSYHISQTNIKKRDVVILYENDLVDSKEGTIITLHESAHHIKGHGKEAWTTPEKEKLDEKDAWNQVRKWLKDYPEFTPCIDKLENSEEEKPGILIVLEQKQDSEWIAKVPDFTKNIGYGETWEEAISRAKALVLRALADRLENGEKIPEGFLPPFHYVHSNR